MSDNNSQPTPPDTTQALKYDAGKPRLSLIPREALHSIARGLAYGAKKYGRYNFEKGHPWSKLLDAASRHIAAFAAGEFIDEESGNSHLDHALSSLSMLAYDVANHPELDDLTREPAPPTEAK